MKKIFLTVSILVATFAFVACNGDAKSEAQKQIDSMRDIIAQQNIGLAERDSLMAMLNEVDSTFAQLEAEYAVMQEMSRKNPEANRRTITDRMAALQETMAANKEKIRQLNGRIKALNGKNNDLQAYITRLEERSAAQEAQIAELLTELENNKVVIKGLNKNVSDLTASNQEKDQYIAKQIADANRAWFVVGTYNELKEAGIVAKTGGFIGIGRKQGTVAGMSTERFTEIDRTKVTTITINMKKAQVISKHPENSYELVADEEESGVTAYLRILNPTLFWKYTDYLVVSTK
jgi:septal ring factor EnvC (AmiA/AmiB activator)